jgi:fructan beta-fructosidase
MDRGSIEVFADKGLTVMTGLFFSQQPMTGLRVNTTDAYVIKKMAYTALGSAW